MLHVDVGPELGLFGAEGGPGRADAGRVPEDALALHGLEAVVQESYLVPSEIAQDFPAQAADDKSLVAIRRPTTHLA